MVTWKEIQAVKNSRRYAMRYAYLRCGASNRSRTHLHIHRETDA